ncbi:MAG TPA: flagellar hook-basal body complex protein FliE [Chloroflexota bacterium]|nr:flagellar hook-basal body complex protein FliE [Chloroflexota bacterium]
MAIGPINPYLPAAPALKPPVPQAPPIAAQPQQSNVVPQPPIAAERQQSRPDSASGGPGDAAASFAKLLGDAVQNIDGLQKAADANVQKLATGQPVDLHDVTISMEQANLTFQLGMQVRNKLIDAYQEVMRMQV